MAVEVNLLPEESRVSTGMSRILGVARILGVIGLAAFLIFGLGMAAFFIYSSIQLSALKKGNSDLENQITSLQKSEQQVVLIKDRLGKIHTLNAMKTAIPNLQAASPLISTLSTNSSITELDVDPSKIGVSINFKSQSDISNFLNNLASSKNFGSITISTFSFNPSAGYQVTFSLVSK